MVGGADCLRQIRYPLYYYKTVDENGDVADVWLDYNGTPPSIPVEYYEKLERSVADAIVYEDRDEIIRVREAIRKYVAIDGKVKPIKAGSSILPMPTTVEDRCNDN